jgi:hypothetical protein
MTAVRFPAGGAASTPALGPTQSLIQWTLWDFSTD